MPRPTADADFARGHNRYLDPQEFVEDARCDICGVPVFSDQAYTVEGAPVCESCHDEMYCGCCGGYRNDQYENYCPHESTEACEAYATAQREKELSR